MADSSDTTGLNSRSRSPEMRDAGGSDRERFVETAARLAAEVYDFHERWALESGTPLEMIVRRTPMLDEEVRELKEEVERPAAEFNEAAMAEEAADVLFVALGHMEQLGAMGLVGMDTVTAKNIAKTTKSHFKHPVSGKVTRIGRKLDPSDTPASRGVTLEGDAPS
ncbi:MAG TPA: MazG nucleotide pyrophosphohydrolase domain-containing protein [Dehalococcoidia bacterium]|jgi:NTP pyrophosphatase (non-canonical NTP hydrolase)|nr:MazG nucleotide pyrophosphohydrolase domain-containing protein [Dehalococcoidia bacterium]MDP7160207.1 MazG nucleotide pyrophosphohydrolase domain-containing protein [Dehalococcoidia bacterium]MDP7214280.1 MazG nucleotide pyrophosphohydrolase domain-containing protein [Dehalococcoidia bacterium]MDP7514173.1 MazG nucleotide pyrophosphohydrolase domain-containing protein [Dehalococcoidia bacterium]HJM53968.1 MazG nucleotide pyrophosphohydrolase domain-containing protein [Dehalococcoidia bacter|tara:strand:+ start:841 stop:1338 length:498 start_codon:yes stop_codon:yes gene_type:complete